MNKTHKIQYVFLFVVVISSYHPNRKLKTQPILQSLIEFYFVDHRNCELKLHKEICKLCGMTMEMLPIESNTWIHPNELNIRTQYYLQLFILYSQIDSESVFSHRFFSNKHTVQALVTKKTLKKILWEKKKMNNSYKSSHCNETHTNTERKRLNLSCVLSLVLAKYGNEKKKKKLVLKSLYIHTQPTHIHLTSRSNYLSTHCISFLFCFFSFFFSFFRS